MNVSLSVTYRKINMKKLKEEYKNLLNDSNIVIDNLRDLSFVSDVHHQKIYNDYKSWVSNTSKGNKTNFEQIIEVFKNDRTTNEINLKKYSNSIEEEFELVNLKKIYDDIDNYSFKLKHFKKVNEILGKHLTTDNFNETRGKFKKEETKQQHIKFNEITTYNISFCEPKDVKKELKKLLSFIKSKTSKKNTAKEMFILATIFLVEFNRIHPFTSGNGRISKIFFEKIFEMNNTLPLILFDHEGKEKFKEILHSSEFLNEDTKMKHSYKQLVFDFHKLYDPKSEKVEFTFNELLKRTN